MSFVRSPSLVHRACQRGSAGLGRATRLRGLRSRPGSPRSTRDRAMTGRSSAQAEGDRPALPVGAWRDRNASGGILSVRRSRGARLVNEILRGAAARIGRARTPPGSPQACGEELSEAPYPFGALPVGRIEVVWRCSRRRVIVPNFLVQEGDDLLGALGASVP